MKNVHLVARDVMRARDRLVVMTPSMDIDRAISLLLKHRISGAPVVERDRLVGVLSERDCLKLLANTAMYDWPSGPDTVGAYMTRGPKVVSPDTDIITIAGLFMSNRFRRVPVIGLGGDLVGQISRRDVLRGIKEMRTVTPNFPDYRAPAH